jgi:ESCRT-I complex subunit VPS37
MTLHGIIASHSWLDIRMKVIGYKPISSDKSWHSSKLKLGDAVYAVIHHLQLHPPSVSQIVDDNLARLQRTLTGAQQTTKSSPHTAAATATTTSHNNAHTQRIDKKESACKVDEDELNSLIPRVPSSFPQIDDMSLSELNDLVNNKAALDTFIDSISEVNTLRELKESIETSNVDTAKSNLALEDKLESISSEVDTLKHDLKSNIERYRELEARRIAMTRPPDIQDVRRQLTSAKKAAYIESEEFADDWVESGGNDVSGFVKQFMDVRVLYHTRAAKAERLGMSM